MVGTREWGFSFVAPWLWNSLLVEVRQDPNVLIFHRCFCSSVLIGMPFGFYDFLSSFSCKQPWASPWGDGKVGQKLDE